MAQGMEKLGNAFTLAQPTKKYDQWCLADPNTVCARIGDAIMSDDYAAFLDAQKCRQRCAITLAERHNAVRMLEHSTYERLLAPRTRGEIACVIIVMQMQYVTTSKDAGGLRQDQFSGSAAAARDMDVMNSSRSNDPILHHHQDGAEQARRRRHD